MIDQTMWQNKEHVQKGFRADIYTYVSIERKEGGRKGK